MSEFFPEVSCWFLSPEILNISFAEMKLDGIEGNEGSCLWLGQRFNGQARITRVVGLRGAGVQKHPAFLHISDDLLFKASEVAEENGETLLAQIHSHGPGYGVDLSPTDHRYGIRVPFFLSIVAPDYACRLSALVDCGVHVFEEDRGFRRFSRAETTKRVVFDMALPSHSSIIGLDNE